VIALVVNLTAGIFKEMIPIVGLFFAFLILLLGHIFNILISSLGAFIHSMRLQFVEFIPKFMEGGGKMFKPFLRESKYVEVIS
jgi:V/A-type H+-transporting ATPase subunit I